ncbi:MAG: hypothetical protein ACW963_00110, partial [Candidatus Sifarchaeia archaeon]
TAVVDGNPGEWDLTADFYADMYRAGDDGKTVESKLYLRYNPVTETLYILVLTEPGVDGLKLPDDAWAAIDDISNKVVTGNSGDDGTPPDFAWVNPTNGNVDGFEASFNLPVRGEYQLIVHIQVFDDAESQTSKTIKPSIPLLTVPETVIATTLIATLAAGGVFYLYKKRHNPQTINNVNL